MTDNGDVIVDEDATYGAAQLYVWRYLRNIDFLEKKAMPRTPSAYSVTDNSFTRMSSTRALAHIFGRKVIGQSKVGVKVCIAINDGDDDRRGDLAKNELGVVVREKEGTLD